MRRDNALRHFALPRMFKRVRKNQNPALKLSDAKVDWRQTPKYSPLQRNPQPRRALHSPNDGRVLGFIDIERFLDK